ncbi:MAG: hypothetical protein QM754_17490 [Tepidisphaeraceae bacterium]
MKIEVNQGLGPGAWLRNRRPEEFSDSETDTQPVLDRATLEYQLDTLGNRSQESDFEQFAHALASAEICPNLLPQTGPTGGGDSKVDAETYPVAPDLTLNWFLGEPEKASSERWAFAFSTKEDWATKVRQDVAKIAAVKRDYKRAYYISSRFIRDKRRAEVEDELTKEYGIDVRILDRNWIVERVYVGHHEVMAAEKLGLSVPKLATRRLGPLDHNREQALAEAEIEANDLKQKLSDPYSARRLVAALLEIAILTRALEHPPEQIEGRFAAARRAAKKYGTTQQTVEAAYEWARTAFWWLEDAEMFEEAFNDVEELIGDANDVYLLDIRCTLLLLKSVAGLENTTAAADNAERRRRLAEQFDLLSTADDAPNAVAVARMRATCLRLFNASPERTAELLRELSVIADASHGLIGFPLAELVHVVSEHGRYGIGIAGYDDVLEHVTQLLADQKGNVLAAKALVHRSSELIVANRPYRAIVTVGKALMRLVSHQGRDTLTHALFLLGTAYENVGLLWAARAAFIHATAVSLEHFYETNEATENQVTCFMSVRQIEVRLGRMAHALAWHACARHFMSVVDGKIESKDRLDDEVRFNALFTALLLRTPCADLGRLSGLVGSLDRLGLPASEAAALLILGYEDDAQKALQEMGISESASAFFSAVIQQPAMPHLAAAPLWHDSPIRVFTSVVLGCEVRITTDGDASVHNVGEMFVTMLEAFLATGMTGDRPIIALLPCISVNITGVGANELGSGRLVESESAPASELHNLNVRVACHDPASLAPEQRDRIQQQTIECVIRVVAFAFALGDDLEQLFERFKQERIHDRTLGITSTAACLRRAIGNMPLTIDGWFDPSSFVVPLRKDPWKPNTSNAGSSAPTDAGPARNQENKRRQWEDLGHTDIRAASLIHREQWRAAGFWGYIYFTSPDPGDPPIISPCFANREKGRGVISDIRDQLMTKDPEHDFKLAIIRGISSAEPMNYRIMIGSFPRRSLTDMSAKMFTTMTLGKDLTPTDHTNLNRFSEGYAKHGCARLFPVSGIQANAPQGLECHYDLDIMLKDIEITDAWKVDERSFAACGIMPGDKPYIPPNHETDAPVLAVLRNRDLDTRDGSVD